MSNNPQQSWLYKSQIPSDPRATISQIPSDPGEIISQIPSDPGAHISQMPSGHTTGAYISTSLQCLQVYMSTSLQVPTSLQVSTRHTSTGYIVPQVTDDLHTHTSDIVTDNPRPQSCPPYTSHKQVNPRTLQRITYTKILEKRVYKCLPVHRNDHTQHPQSSHILQCLHVLQSLHILQSLQVYKSTSVYRCLQVYKCLRAYILSIHPIKYSFQTSTQRRRIRSSQH